MRNGSISRPQQQWFLPVFYAVLNSQYTPELDGIPSGPTLQRIVYALECLYVLRHDIPPAAFVDLWPRLWGSISLFEADIPDLRLFGGDAIRVIFWEIVQSFHTGETAELIETTPGVCKLAARAWRTTLEREDIFHDMGFKTVCRFLDTASIVIEEFIAGAGSPTALALLVIQHFKVVLVDPLEHGWPLCAAISFLVKTGDLNTPLRQALLANGIVRVLTHAVCALASSINPFLAVNRADILTRCLALVIHWFTGPPTRWLVQALKAGLLDGLVDISRLYGNEPAITPLKLIIENILPAHMAYYSVISEVERAFPDRGLELPDFTDSETFANWEPTLELMRKRIDMIIYYDNDHKSLVACDNGPCGDIQPKSDFRRCSRCHSAYYCSSACQNLDWREGGHRRDCKRLRTLRNSEPLSTRDLSFLHYFFHFEYRCHKCEILTHQVIHVQSLPIHPRPEFYTLFWYRRGQLELSALPVGEYPAGYDWGIDWEYHQRRMVRSEGKMELHLMVTSDDERACARMLPKRARSAYLDAGVRRIANAEPRVPREEMRIDADAIKGLLDEDDGGIH
ncbi:hypothetical protein B0H11DRAFT_2101460 [Mycena galericulata]|nr:hypothetical protein B0H11DRAFT_2101460 [Mycena galericulata]